MRVLRTLWNIAPSLVGSRTRLPVCLIVLGAYVPVTVVVGLLPGRKHFLGTISADVRVRIAGVMFTPPVVMGVAILAAVSRVTVVGIVTVGASRLAVTSQVA